MKIDRLKEKITVITLYKEFAVGKENFVEKLNEVVGNTGGNKELIILGDFRV